MYVSRSHRCCSSAYRFGSETAFSTCDMFDHLRWSKFTLVSNRLRPSREARLICFSGAIRVAARFGTRHPFTLKLMALSRCIPLCPTLLPARLSLIRIPSAVMQHGLCVQASREYLAEECRLGRVAGPISVPSSLHQYLEHRTSFVAQCILIEALPDNLYM